MRQEDKAMPKNSDLKKRVVRASAWQITKRIIKPLPIVGSVFAVGLAGYTIKKKGLLRGSIDVALNVTPIVGTAKGIVEIVTGDILPDKHESKKRK